MKTLLMKIVNSLLTTSFFNQIEISFLNKRAEIILSFRFVESLVLVRKLYVPISSLNQPPAKVFVVSELIKAFSPFFDFNSVEFRKSFCENVICVMRFSLQFLTFCRYSLQSVSCEFSSVNRVNSAIPRRQILIEIWLGKCP